MRIPVWLVLLLGVLTAVGPVSTDMYLPAFPALEASLQAPAGSAQITLAAWFAGLAFGQITHGSLSDRFGRRWPLIVGTTLYTAASIGCALAPGLLSFSVGRVFAAFGGSASMVIPRAVVRDVADGPRAARLFSSLMLINGAVPILAPSLGGAVLAFASWRVIFWAAAVYGGLCTLIVCLWMPDTLPPNRRMKLRPGGVLVRYIGIAREPQFATNALVGGLGLAGLFAYLAGSPAAYMRQYGVSPSHFGMLFGLNAAGLIGAAQLNARVLSRLSMSAVLSGAVRVGFGAAVVLAIDAFAGFGGILGLVLPLFVLATSLGFTLPNAAAGALSRHARRAASASALLGTWQFALGAITGSLVGVLADGTARPMAVIMLACAGGAAIADRYRPRR
jgi:DHA1 family bicyclomycin/chloramphenicol resistance-like MFS transporter